jgi:hypothetical protein
VSSLLFFVSSNQKIELLRQETEVLCCFFLSSSPHRIESEARILGARHRTAAHLVIEEFDRHVMSMVNEVGW